MRRAIMKIVRKLSVISPDVSLIRTMLDNGDHYANFKSREDIFKKYPQDLLLKEVFGEAEPCEILQRAYSNALRGESNELFIVAHPVSSRYCISIEDDNIVLMTMNNDSLQLFDWEYPTNIYVLGKARGRSITEIVSDFKSLSTIAFFQKYVLDDNSALYHRPIISKEFENDVNSFYEDCKHRLPYVRVYTISDSLLIMIDTNHVFLFKINDKSIDLNSCQNISDNWYYSDNQILGKLRFLPIIKFSKELNAHWVSSV